MADIPLPRRPAVEPRVSARSQPLPTAENIASVQMPRDPGLNVPSFGGSGRGLEAVGTAAGDFIGEFAKRHQSRFDAVEFARALDDHTKFTDETSLKFSTERDFSRKDDLEDFGKTLAERRVQLLGDFKGSADARARLEARLIGIESQAAGRAGAVGATIAETRAKSTLTKVLPSLGEGVRQSASRLGTGGHSLDSVMKDINSAFQTYDARLDDVRGLFDPTQEDSQRQAGRDQIAADALNVLIMRGDDAAAETLITGSLQGLVSDKVRNGTLEKIATIRQAKAEASRAPVKGIPRDIFNKLPVADQNAILTGKAPEKTLERIQAEAFAKESGERKARMDGIAALLSQVGAPGLPQGEDGTPGPAIEQPFGPNEQASEDVKKLGQLFATSRRLLHAGETELANGFLAEARFLAENSPDIQRQRELNKPISADLASELGVPVGTTLSSVVDRIPRSPEDQARSKSTARAEGTAQVKAREQIDFISQASGILANLREEAKIDPGILGVRGSLRSTGQTATQVLADIGFGSIVDGARDIAFGNSNLSLDEITKLFESPTLSTLSLIENSVGLILARLRVPDGRVPVEIIKQSIKDVNLTGLTGSKQVMDRLDFIMKNLNETENRLRQRSGLVEEPEETGDKPERKRFRVKDGKFIPAESK